MNDVLVELVHRHGVPVVPLDTLPFRWRAEGGDGLDFEMFHRQHAVTTRAALRPDAVLTIPGRCRRLFIEAETGTQSIASLRVAYSGAVLGKLERYGAYFLHVGGAGASTWYQRAFPDGFAPRLVFLVHSDERRRRVEEAIRRWLGRMPTASFRVVVLTFASAASAIAAYFEGPLPGGKGGSSASPA